MLQSCMASFFTSIPAKASATAYEPLSNDAGSGFKWRADMLLNCCPGMVGQVDFAHRGPYHIVVQIMLLISHVLMIRV